MLNSKIPIYVLLFVGLLFFSWEFYAFQNFYNVNPGVCPEVKNSTEKNHEYICPNITCPSCPTSKPCPTSPTTEPCPTLPPSTPCPTSQPCPPCQPNPGLYSNKRSQARIIVDIFPFGHELDWLEVRLNEYKDVVDYFVIMEGNLTFSRKKKEMFYLKNKDRYANVADKIIHVDCNPGDITSYFGVETNTRLCAKQGVSMAVAKLKEKNIQYTDEEMVIIIADLDEMPYTEMLRAMKWSDPMVELPAKVELWMYYYSFYWSIGTWANTFIINLKIFNENPNHKWHADSINPKTVIGSGGWHCSSCLTPENLKYKIQTFSHTELDTPEITDLGHLSDSIEHGKDWAFRSIYNFVPTPRPGDFPKYILANLDRFSYLVAPKDKFDLGQTIKDAVKLYKRYDYTG